MERVEDSIGGKAVAVVYATPQLPLPTAGSRWARSRQLHRFARANEASHLLRVRDSAGEADTWWAGRAGVSFAAAIDAWAETERRVRDEVVILPLDKRIYAAELEDRLVEREHVLGAARLKEMLPGWQQRSTRAFVVGEMVSALEGVMPLEALPFDPLAHRFRRMSAALTAAGLFAPAQVVAAALVAAAAATPALDTALRGSRDDTGEYAAAVAQDTAAKLEGSFGAAAALRRLADLGWHEAVLLMHHDGLAEMRFEDAFEVSFLGRSATGFPQGAAEYAAAHSATFELTGERWKVRRPVSWGDAERRSVEGFLAQGLALELHAAARAARAEVATSPAVSSGAAEERAYALRIAAATPRDLALLADALAGRPFAVAHAQCTFSGFLASACEIGLVAKGMTR